MNNWNEALNQSKELAVAVSLMKDIKQKFPDGEIYIVGGVPRDLLMGNKISDVDLATNIDVEDLQKYYELRNISKSDSQPVYTILWENYSYDLAKFRMDSETFGRQNNISIETKSFEDDTKRRDFTINSFGLDELGNIIDYQNGKQDIKNKLIRTVGNAEQRFKEDATRILRLFRFAAKMNFNIEENTLSSAIKLKYLLSDVNSISKESISKEFYKAAKSGPVLANFIRLLMENNILEDILPEFTRMKGFDHDPAHHPEGGVIDHILAALDNSPFDDSVLNLAVFFHDFGKAVTRATKTNGYSSYHRHEAAGVPIVESIFDRLKFPDLSQQDKKGILFAVDRHMLIHNINKLNIKTLNKLIQNPHWYVVKAVGYADEASRGKPLFNEEEFNQKIKDAEDKIHKIGKDSNEVKNKIKNYIDGYKLLEWFPELNENKKMIKVMLDKAQGFILEKLHENQEPTIEEIKSILKNE